MRQALLHYLNPLHVYCRLCGVLPRALARRLADAYGVVWRLLRPLFLTRRRGRP